MQRMQAALAAIAVIAFIFGGFVIIRTITRLIWAAVWFIETVAIFAFAVLIGYIAYRVFLGESDDPRISY